MGVFLENSLLEICYAITAALCLLYLFLTKHYSYWTGRGVPCKTPEFPFGSTKEIVLAQTFVGKAHDNIYKQFPKDRFYGIIEFQKPVLVLKDPELIKQIMVKDFQSFVDRPVLMGSPKEYMMKHLLNLVGQEWKDMRAKLTPTFTSGKMKAMFGLMEKCSETLKEQLECEIKDTKVIDAKNILSRFTMDIIASCAFGLDTNALTEQNTQFYKVFGGIAKSTFIRHIRRMIIVQYPSLLKHLRVELVRPEVRDFVTNIVRDTIAYRQKNEIKRNDFLDLLMNITIDKNNWEENGHANVDRNTNTTKEALTIEQMTAQTFVFFIAGFETASSLMAFCLYELSCHQDIQERLYQEIQEAADRNEGKLSYQTLMEIPFLDQVINETLRLYGSAHVLTRVCTQTYKIPDSDVVLEKGIKVIIPLFSLHHDPQYYPDPYDFKPERFTPEETKLRHPFVFMPFGEGPRNCIGMRFGLLEAKVGLTTALLNFQVDLSPEQEVPIEIDKRSLAFMPAKPVLLKFTKRKTD